jgi:acetylornithine/N-succinyldiaminopimelate aminotransferase
VFLMTNQIDQGTSSEAATRNGNYLLNTYARPSFVISHGEGMYAWDTEGREYLDFTAGIAVNALGHADPGLAAALAAQAGKLVHTSNLYHTIPQSNLAEKLVANSFASRVFFSNSGTEANEAAIKFARKYARTRYGRDDKTHLLCFDHAFHGRSMGALSLTPKPLYQDAFRPLLADVLVAPFNDEAALADHITEQTCAVFIEPVQGEGGVHPATDSFLRALRARCDEVGALLVFDEVQCGLGRTGDLWAHTASGITPDIMTLAKPLAGGLPIGAVLVSKAVADLITPGDHGSTFAGGPLITAAACYVFDRINQPAFLQNVQNVGAYLRDCLAEINSPHIQEIRGRGLMLGIALDIPASKVVEKGYAHGLLLVSAGPNVVRVIPPLVAEPRHVDQFAERLSQVLADL